MQNINIVLNPNNNLMVSKLQEEEKAPYRQYASLVHPQHARSILLRFRFIKILHLQYSNFGTALKHCCLKE